MKVLGRTTPCQLFKIRAPIWNAGRRFVGLDEKRIWVSPPHNEIHFEYRRKSDGELSMPDAYYFDGSKLKRVDYERQNRYGTTLVLIPFSDLEQLVRE